MITAHEARSEDRRRTSLSVKHWIDDLPWQQANERLESQPTVNIEGLVAATPAPAARPSCRTARSPSSTCASCPT
jgi:hypothetical protein